MSELNVLFLSDFFILNAYGVCIVFFFLFFLVVLGEFNSYFEEHAFIFS